MLKKVFLFVSLLFSVLTWSQTDSSKLKYHGNVRDTAFCVRHDMYHAWSWNHSIIFKVGYMYSGCHAGELGVGWAQLIGTTCDPYGNMGLTIGSEFLFDQDLIYGPKLSAEAHFLFLGSRLNTTFLTSDFSYGSLKIRPEVGFTILGYINVFYGYTFNVTNSTYYNQRHSFSLFGNIPMLKFYGHRRIKRVDKPRKEK